MYVWLYCYPILARSKWPLHMKPWVMLMNARSTCSSPMSLSLDWPPHRTGSVWTCIGLWWPIICCVLHLRQRRIPQQHGSPASASEQIVGEIKRVSGSTVPLRWLFCQPSVGADAAGARGLGQSCFARGGSGSKHLYCLWARPPLALRLPGTREAWWLMEEPAKPTASLWLFRPGLWQRCLRCNISTQQWGILGVKEDVFGGISPGSSYRGWQGICGCCRQTVSVDFWCTDKLVYFPFYNGWTTTAN